MATYTNKQKAIYYLEKYNGVLYNPLLCAIYWKLYKAYNEVDKAHKMLEDYRQQNPIRKQIDYQNLKLKR